MSGHIDDIKTLLEPPDEFSVIESFMLVALDVAQSSQRRIDQLADRILLGGLAEKSFSRPLGEEQWSLFVGYGDEEVGIQ